MKRIVKKYPNRKLYDTTDKHYVTLSDLEDFLRKGVKFQVFDTETHEDITDITVAQIILEMARKGRLPRRFLDVLVNFIARH
jgi:polyhydroxyalkanoate synthesis repressor PhaR